MKIKSIDRIFLYFFLFAVFRSESAKMDSKPTSWPRSRMESHLTKTSREKRKLQSSSPSSRNHPSSVGRMKRFQKSSAIYTLPIRGKQHNGTHCITGKSINYYFYACNDFLYVKDTNRGLRMNMFDFGGVILHKNGSFFLCLIKM